MGSGWWVQIIILAMLAGFIALRLVSVLGRRTGHERPVGDAFRAPAAEVAANSAPTMEVRARPAIELPKGADPQALAGLQAIAAADAAFDPARFVDGAKGAYAMILDAFWKGDVEPVHPYVSDEVAEQFRRAIAVRSGDHALPSRVVSVDAARIVAAHVDGNMAEAVIGFEAAIAAAEGTVTAHDEWTFRRHLGTRDPNWLLVATEAAEAAED